MSDISPCGFAQDPAPNGAFVIRKPGKPVANSHPDTLALSVQAGPRVCNALLRAHEFEGTVWWSITNQYFQDITDLVRFATVTPFNFPKLEGSGLVTLNLKSAKKAEATHQVWWDTSGK